MGWHCGRLQFDRKFILRVHDEYLRVGKADPARGKLLNIRYAGLQDTLDRSLDAPNFVEDV